MRIYVPDEERDRLGYRPVVVCSEVVGNGGDVITKATEEIYRGVRETFRLPEVVWIEHHPAATTDGTTETFELVHFARPASKPSWKPLDRKSVEVLVGGESL